MLHVSSHPVLLSLLCGGMMVVSTSQTHVGCCGGRCCSSCFVRSVYTVSVVVEAEVGPFECRLGYLHRLYVGIVFVAAGISVQ